MKKEHKAIIEVITSYLEKYPEIRFGQMLANLDINESQCAPDGPYVLRDIYFDSNKKILQRIHNSLQP